ncbi:sorbitol dehydrogenase [Drechmeria coniospora]|uniref:Sorbitol dehydrogenase n=1 Tax=Drechmeria coniospora TaxID=98403 RepID=A0A151GIS8_DRECN|nr:sorbitol dehydrogenase [Drechmeria coniospora]KYK56996.1 sorbitol dehydrogenase [Drechmeria coniospora]
MSVNTSATASVVKASVLHGALDLRIEDRELAPPASSEVQVAVQSTGICGSDLHYYAEFRNGDIQVREPLTLGHESSGTVVAIGRAVTGLGPGDRVALEVGLPCEACQYCYRGQYNICHGMRFRGSAKVFPHTQGTLQKRINHPARWCHKLPPNLSLDHGALVEPLSVAMHAFSRSALLPGANVLVFGAGTIGLLAGAVSKVYNSVAVVIADVRKDRVDFAVANGYADAGFVVPAANPQTTEDKLAFAKDVAEKIKALTVSGKSLGGICAVYECTGVEMCLQSAIYAVCPGSKIMMIGMGTPVLSVHLAAALQREVDLIGVFRYANTYKAAINMLADKPDRLPELSKLVTHRFKGMDRIADAFAMAARKTDDDGNLVLKVIIDMQ